jgi:hypothetical protein
VATKRVYLIECVDAAGAAPADAQWRAAAIEHAGVRVQAIAIECGSADDAALDGPIEAGRIPRVRAGQDGFAAVRTVLCDTRPDLVIVASAAAGGGPVASVVPADVPAAWWPSGLGGEPARVRFGAPRRLLDPLEAGRPGELALTWAVVPPVVPSRGRLPLWDGDYVLVPMPPGRESALEIFDAFALASADGHAHELVVLCDPDPALESIARRLGVGTRVHFAGPAPREAESAWMSFAALTVVAGPRPIAAGLPLRALAHGCPVHVAGNDPVSGTLRHWLGEHGALACAGTTIEAFAEVLEHEGPRRRDASRRAWMRACTPEAVGARLAASWAPAAPRRRAA